MKVAKLAKPQGQKWHFTQKKKKKKKLSNFNLDVVCTFVNFLNRFLRLLIERLHLPTYCLVDCDPYGFDILTTYRFGSMQMAYDAKIMKLPEIKWLGVLPSDAETFNVPQQCLLPMTTEDKIKTEAILNRCYLQREVPQWRLELQLLLQSGVKFETEALSVHSLDFLSKQYLPSKIQGEIQLHRY
ncbi:putative DNA topoisomerase (ATP-hydrolyzing) [Helianthus annuus]|nr:putative DNA topoisomerase (ATP-hydrolyzing) [Helianthus annuus]KAJ0688639.1 putative DNA topoisomerase (ATP-hydrolyzing) [Helianthus annuus]